MSQRGGYWVAMRTGMRGSMAGSQRRVRIAVVVRLRARVQARTWVLFASVGARHTTRTRTDARSSTVSGVCVHSLAQAYFFLLPRSHRCPAVFGRDQVTADVPWSVSARVDAPAWLARCALPQRAPLCRVQVPRRCPRPSHPAPQS